MNNKGFTLVEVLAVIVILSIIGAIMTPSVTNIIKQNKVKSCENLKKSIVSACRVYVSDNRNDILNGERCSSGNIISKNVTLDSLELNTDNGKIINPVTGNEVNVNIVDVSFDCNTKKFTCTYKLDC